MKKLLCLVLCLALMVPFCAFAETEVDPLALNYEALPEDYVGTWVLSGAYTAADGMLEVAPEAMTINMELSIDYNLLVDMERYIHADAISLSGEILFNHEEIDPEENDGANVTASWDAFTTVNVIGEGEIDIIGAAKCKLRKLEDEDTVFFQALTGVELEEEEGMEAIGLNANGQLVIGYSEDKIEKDPEATFLYAYIFDKVETETAAE